MENKNIFRATLFLLVVSLIINSSFASVDIKGCIFDSKGNPVASGTPVDLYLNGELRGNTTTHTDDLSYCSGNANLYVYMSLQPNDTMIVPNNSIVSISSNYTLTSGEYYGKTISGVFIDGDFLKMNITVNKPGITLISPADNANIITSAFNINYTVVDDYNLTNCSLIINGTVNQTNTGQNFTVNLANGDYTWAVNCTDDHGYWSVSETRNVKVGIIDTDNDTYDSSNDCNDSNSAINPGAAEVCNTIDDNCNGQIDENLTRATTCGVGKCSGNSGNETCNLGVWSNNTCNPVAGAVSEICGNSIDEDCNGADLACQSTGGGFPPSNPNTGNDLANCTEWSVCSISGQQTRDCITVHSGNKLTFTRNCTYVKPVETLTSYCGDKICNLNENCTTCPADCSVCPEGNSGGNKEEGNVSVEKQPTQPEVLGPYALLGVNGCPADWLWMVLLVISLAILANNVFRFKKADAFTETFEKEIRKYTIGGGISVLLGIAVSLCLIWPIAIFIIIGIALAGVQLLIKRKIKQ